MGFKTRGQTPQGSPGTTDFEFYGWTGLNVKGAGQIINDTDLTIAYNVYLRPDGALQLRNGMNPFATAIAGSNQFILARYYQGVRNGAAILPQTLTLLGQFGNTLYSVPNSGAPTAIGSISNGVTNAQPMTVVQLQDANDPHFASGLTDVMVICTGSGGPYVYDGTNLYTPVGWASAANAQWCALVNGILWFGGINALPNQVFGTGDGVIQSMETLPAIRNFILSTHVMGLCAQGSGATAALVIGLNGGISVLYGTGPSTFYKQDIPMSDGVTAGRSMVADAGTIFFLGNNAAFSFDGQTIPQAITQKVEPWILNDPLYQGANNYPMTQNRGLSWGQIYNNRYHIGYCSGSTVPNTILTYDLTVRGWTVLQTAPGLASMALLNAPTDADPTVAVVGSATTGQAYTWDYVASFSANALPSMDGSTPVLAAAQTKYFKLGAPGTNKMLTRFYPEFLVSSTPFAIPFTVSTDYGNTTTSRVVENAAANLGYLIWDVGLWDVGLWGGVSFTSFNAPASRIDFDIQAEAFAFGIRMSAALAPWIWTGGSGSFSQKGRT